MQRMYDYSYHNSRSTRDCGCYQQNERKMTSYVGKCCIQPEGALPNCPVVAMAYVPFQMSTELYDDCKALERGTAFPCLDKPFNGGNCRC